MGARTVPVEELTAENTEVRGFNGRATVNCGFSLPIVRHQPTGLYCALSVTRTPGPVWSTEEEIREFEASGRVTLLSDTERLEAASGAHQVTYAPEAILLPNDWNVVPRKQPVLIWVKGRFLRNLSMTEHDLPYTYGHFSRWFKAAPPKKVQTDNPYLEPKFYVGCTSANKCEYLLDTWGEQAKHYFDKGLTKELTDRH